MKSITIFSLAILLTILPGCGSKNGKAEPADSLSEVNSDTVTEVEHDHSHDDSILLNEGKKWVVDPPMLKFIRTMEKDVAEFTLKKGDQMKQYNALAEVLSLNIDSLTSNCTMKGQAHDELHKWLLPYIDLVDAFGETDTTVEAEEKLVELRKTFVVFNYYFE